MISIQKITLHNLGSFVSSKTYKELRNKPISKARAESYLKNPRANKNNVVLYMAFVNNELLGYRTILPDCFFVENSPKYFGWLSGSWVQKKHRRKGISTLLLNEALKDWDNKLMSTNYVKASKLVFDKTKKFTFLQELKGTKYYTRFCLADILPKKKKIFSLTKYFWSVLDFLLNLFVNFKRLFYQEMKNNYHFKVNEKLEQSILEFIEPLINQNLFKRNQKEFNWIQNYPWVLSDNKTKENSKNYFFSSYSKEFESNYYTIYNNDNSLIGFILVSVRDGHLKVPYAYYNKKDSKVIASFIRDKCSKMNVKSMIVYDVILEEELNNQLLFLTKKKFVQKYFMTRELEKLFKVTQEIKIQSGDGDVVFT